jgi:plasmid replication initiation protein
MTNEEKTKQQHGIVIKSNELIRKSRFSLSVIEQRIVIYLISQIKPDDTERTEYEFDIKDFCEVCGIEYYYNLFALKDIIKSLRDKSVWIKLPNGAETTVAWIEKPYIYPGTGKVKIRLDRDMIPYLVQLKSNFTQYELMAILGLKSKFSIRLYEIFKSYEFAGKVEIDIEELRKMLMIENEYKKFYDFRRYVVDKAIEEITVFTDLNVSYTLIKDGRMVKGFEFTIEQDPLFNGEYYPTELYLEGKIPSRHKKKQLLKEHLSHKAETAQDEPLPNQIGLFDE